LAGKTFIFAVTNAKINTSPSVQEKRVNNPDPEDYALISPQRGGVLPMKINAPWSSITAKLVISDLAEKTRFSMLY
jgi:hypothetical protein